MTHQLLTWDSEFFKLKIAALRTPGFFNPPDLEELVNKLKEEGFQLLYLYVSPEDQATIAFAAAQGWRLVDEKITYSLDLSNVSEFQPTGEVVAFTAPIASEELVSLAIQSAVWSRFKTDPNFPPEAHRKLYREWIENSVKGQLADSVQVHQTEGQTDGLVTIKVTDNIGIIGLIGVDQSVRGRGIGTQLISATINYCLARQVKQIRVDTQKQNAAACRFYEKNNFQINDLINVYHLWL